MTTHLRRLVAAALLVAPRFSLAAEPPAGELPRDAAGRALNLDFEAGDLRDWDAEGEAFAQMPVKGDTVRARRPDTYSGHQGDFWIGSYERRGDGPTGKLESAEFKVTQPWASFLLAGGAHAGTRVELVDADTGTAFFKASGYDQEPLRPVVVDLKDKVGKEIYLRLVDEETGGWGHVNFDNFRLHAQRPQFANELKAAEAQAAAEPVADVVPFAGLSPAEGAKAITLPPNFAAHVFAAEPDVVQPIAFALDPRGRVWVAEGRTYPKRKSHPPKEPLTPPAAGETGWTPTPAHRADIFGGDDRILVLEDTDGDHKFDKKTVFLENVNLISGLEVGFGGIWIGAAPYLMFVPVTDWENPKPAGDPRILLDGWDYAADTHETLNTFTWGPDGWLYGCHGVFCPSHVGTPGTPMERRQRVDCAVWRYHPVRHEFEVFSEGTSNPWGIDFDQHGQLFLEACVIPHFWHMIQGARYQRQGGQHFSITLEEKERVQRYLPKDAPRYLNPFIYADIQTHGDHVHYAGSKGPHAANGRSDAAGGGHAHAGLMVYLGGAWPRQYHNQIFIGNIHGQRLNMDLALRRGSGFVGTHGPDFLNFNDTWSQSINHRYDQDGSMYVIDWYDKNQCHHNREDGHDRGNGRVFKIVYGQSPVTRVNLAEKSDLELTGLLTHPNHWHSRTATRLLQERAAAGKADLSLVTKLKAGLREGPTPDRLRALWALHALAPNDEALTLLALLRDPDEYMRAWAVQLLAERRNPSPAAMVEFTRLAREDDSQFVRLYLAAAMQRTPVEQRAPVLAALMGHPEDAADHNLPLMYWYALEPVVGAQPELALKLIGETKVPLLRQFITRRLVAGSPEVAAR